MLTMPLLARSLWLPILCCALGCGPRFENAVTPTGEPCTDMPIFPAGQTVDQPYHRVKPVASKLKASTEAERLESLRRQACKLHADAIIEAANEETRLKNGTGYATRASGTAIRWRRGPAKREPIPSLTNKPPTPAAEPEADEAPAAPEPEQEAK